MAYEQRCKRLRLRPEMASLTTGSVNFPTSIYENSPDLINALAKDMLELGIKPEIEVFDLSMINNGVLLGQEGLAIPPLHFDFVMGLKGAIPASIDNLVYLKNTIPRDATWSVAGVGSAQLPMNLHAVMMGGHVRVGLEDNIYYKKGQLATNEALAERIVRLSGELGREVAAPPPNDDKEILHLT